MGVFDGCQVTLELDSSVRFKQKLELKKKVIDNGGIISFIVTKKVTRPAPGPVRALGVIPGVCCRPLTWW